MNIYMTADLDKKVLKAYGKEMAISCMVRNETNNRGRGEVVYSIPKEKPIQPREFPKGKWVVGKPLPRTHKYLAPYFIPTNAWQTLPVWNVDTSGYLSPSETVTRDEGYGLHYSTSSTTQGCIKIIVLKDLLYLVSCISASIDKGDVVYLEVSKGT